MLIAEYEDSDDYLFIFIFKSDKYYFFISTSKIDGYVRNNGPGLLFLILIILKLFFCPILNALHAQV
jgi:hypothetical protein